MAGGGGGEATLPSRGPQFDTFLPRRTFQDDSSFDITAMIDLVFMMNIFFLVTSLTKSAAEVDLPKAQHCTPADENECIVFMIRNGSDPTTPEVAVSDGSEERRLNPDDLEEGIRMAVERGVELQKKRVLIKAEEKVRLGHIVRVSTLATADEGLEPLFAVMELDEGEKSR